MHHAGTTDTVDQIRTDALAGKQEFSKAHEIKSTFPEESFQGSSPDLEQGTVETVVASTGPLGFILRLENAMGLESRGIERVPEALRERETTFEDYAQMSVIWFSSNITANNLLVGLLGPLLFGVGLVDAMVLGAFGAMFGAMCTAYIGTFGPMSGCRTMVSHISPSWSPGSVS